jgi:trans-aconitate methyltransferase
MFFCSKPHLSQWYWQQEGLTHALNNADRVEWSRPYEAYMAEVTSHLKRGMRVVELGCSGGHWSERLDLHGRGCHYTGIDWNPDSVAFASARYPRAEFRCSDIARISDLKQFDYVLACQALFFLDQQTLQHVLSQMRSGALITISEPSAYDIDSYTRSRSKLRTNKHLNKVMIYKHPYPAMVRKVGFEILSRQFAEFVPGKVKLVMTARRK